MQRLFILLALAFVSSFSYAQIRIGGNFNINIDNEHSSYNSGIVTGKENAFTISVNPKVYWNLSDRIRVGTRVGFTYGTVYTGGEITMESYHDGSGREEETTGTIDRAVGWSVAPFFGYRLFNNIFNWKRVSIWVEANASIGQMYNICEKKYPDLEWNRSTQYAFQILPVVDIDITESLALQLHVGILSLGYGGETMYYDEKTVSRNVWNIRKGGFDGLIQGLFDYGIGIVKKF